MTDISIRIAQGSDDYDIARGLCRAWLEWHWNAYPQDWPIEGNPMAPEKFEVILNDLPELHARPGGAILIASVDGQAAGCVMYNEAEADVAVFNRMFVNEGGRGLGIGRLMFEEMIADGYRKVMFSSATFLIHARKMYEGAGFSDIPHPQGFPEAWRRYVYFMERQL
ncbi:MAG: GNAT family N-acetyltransferase [Rhodobacteraceae bacterium]|nr:GNAT family N-acetyltransferase [Paracoccaceae bacterium]